MKRIREYAKGRKLKCRSGSFRVIFFSGDEPLGEIWMRPCILCWDMVAREVYGRFLFENSAVGVRQWETMFYDRKFDAFLFDAPSSLWSLLLYEQKAKYYDEEDRDEVLALKNKEMDPWQSEEPRKKAAS